MKMMEDTDFSAPEVDPGDDKDSFADIKQEDDYNEIFHPRKECKYINPDHNFLFFFWLWATLQYTVVNVVTHEDPTRS